MGLRFLSLLMLAALAGCSSQTTEAPASRDDGVSSEPDLFADASTTDLTLEAPFGAAFAAAHAGEPNGPLPGLPRRVMNDFSGVLKFTTRAGEAKALDVTLKVRGNSSLSECGFPKLSVKLTDAAKIAARGTMFAKQSKFKIGTHCD